MADNERRDRRGGTPRRGSHAGATPRRQVSGGSGSGAARHASHLSPVSAPASQGARPSRDRLRNLPQIDTGGSEQDAPRPIGVDPAVTGSFRRIDVGEGAKVETRDNVRTISPDSTSSWTRTGFGEEMQLQGRNKPRVRNRETKIKTNKRLNIGIAIAAAVIILLAILAFNGIISHRPSAEQTDSGQVEQTQTGSDGSINYNGTVFSIRQGDDGKYALVGSPEGSSTSSVNTYFEFEGTPVQLVLYNGAIIIPENLGDGWDVLAYTMGAGSMSTQVTDSNGNAVTGSGQITDVKLDGSNLLITDSTGQTTTIALG